MRFLGVIVRILSLGFHLLLTVFMLAVSSLAWGAGQHSLELAFLPWQGASLTYWLFFTGLAGFIVTVLAIKRIVPVLFFIWTLAVFVMLGRGFFFSGYSFGVHTMSLWSALELTAIALLGAVGGFLQMRTPAEVRRRSHALA